jgi:hypothetical protein
VRLCLPKGYHERVIVDTPQRIRRRGRLSLRGGLADVVPLFTAEGSAAGSRTGSRGSPCRTTCTSALSHRGHEVVAHLRDGFDDMLATWQRLAQAVLDHS